MSETSKEIIETAINELKKTAIDKNDTSKHPEIQRVVALCEEELGVVAEDIINGDTSAVAYHLLLLEWLGELHAMQNKMYEAARLYLEPALMQCSLTFDGAAKSRKGRILSKLGICYAELGETAKAKSHFLKSLEIHTQLNEEDGIQTVNECLRILEAVENGAVTSGHFFKTTTPHSDSE